MTQQTETDLTINFPMKAREGFHGVAFPSLQSRVRHVDMLGTGDYNDSSRRESRMESRAGSYQCWGRQAPSHPPCPSLPVLHLSLESLSQMQELYYSYEDCLRNAYSM